MSMQFLIGMHVHYVSGDYIAGSSHLLAHVESVANSKTEKLNLIVFDTVAGKTRLVRAVPFDETNKAENTWHWIEGHWGRDDSTGDS